MEELSKREFDEYEKQNRLVGVDDEVVAHMNRLSLQRQQYNQEPLASGPLVRVWSGNWDQNHAISNINNVSSNHTLNNALAESLPPKLNAFETENSLSKGDDGEIVRGLMNQLHESEARRKSLELQLNHFQLQTRALSEENNKLDNDLAEREQEIALLEEKLNEIANFENYQGLGLETLRGNLLDLANKKIKELSQSEIDLKYDLALCRQRHENDVEALVAELKELSGQMAQRTVLYSAQERRFRDTTRIQDSLDNDQKRELIFLRGQLQQLKERTEKADTDRVDALLSLRQSKETIKALEQQLFEQTDKAEALDRELMEANNTNLMLQQMVDRLRGSDMDEIERGLAANVLQLKRDNRAREEQLMQQLTDAQLRIKNEAEAKEKLSTQITELQREIHEHKQLLFQVQNSKYLDQDVSTANFINKGNKGRPVALKFDDTLNAITQNSFNSVASSSSLDGSKIHNISNTNISVDSLVIEENSYFYPEEDDDASLSINQHLRGVGIESTKRPIGESRNRYASQYEETIDAEDTVLIADKIHSEIRLASMFDSIKDLTISLLERKSQKSADFDFSENIDGAMIEDLEEIVGSAACEAALDMLKEIASMVKDIVIDGLNRKTANNISSNPNQVNQCDDNKNYELTTDFLIGLTSSDQNRNIENMTSSDNRQSENENNNSQVIFDLEARVRQLEEEGSGLREVIADQREKMVEILRRAATLNVESADIAEKPINIEAERAEHRRVLVQLRDVESDVLMSKARISSLEAQLQMYRQEAELAEERAKSLQEVARHEAENIYSPKLLDLEEHVHALEIQLQNNQTEYEQRSRDWDTQLSNLQEQLLESMEINNELHDKCNLREERVNALEEKLKASEECLAEARKLGKEWEEKEHQAREILCKTKEEVNSLARANENLLSASKYEIDFLSLKTQFDGQKSLVELLEKERDKLLERVSTLQSDLVSYEHSADQYKRSTQSVIDELKSQQINSAAVIADLKSQLETAEQRERDLGAVLEDFNSNAEAIERRLIDSESANAALRQELDSVLQARDQLNERMKSEFLTLASNKVSSDESPMLLNVHYSNLHSPLPDSNSLIDLQAQHAQELEQQRKAYDYLLAEQKKKLSAKYKARLQKQVDVFEAEMKQMQQLVRSECQEAIKAAASAHVMRSAGDKERSRALKSCADKATATNTHDEEAVLHPEMLSPEATLELVKRVVKRFSSADDVKAMLDIASSESKVTPEEIPGDSSRSAMHQELFITPRTSFEGIVRQSDRSSLSMSQDSNSLYGGHSIMNARGK